MKTVEHFIPFSPLTFKTCSDKAKDSNFNCSVVPPSVWHSQSQIQPQTPTETMKAALSSPGIACEFMLNFRKKILNGVIREIGRKSDAACYLD